jgi:centrosomal protein CEP120
VVKDPLAVPEIEPTEKTDIDTILRCEDKDIREVPRTFSYNLVIQSVKFNRRPDNGIWQLSFQHPKADTPFTKINIEFSVINSKVVDLNRTQMQLYFSSLPENVIEKIISDACRLTIHGPHGLYAFAELDNQNMVIGHKEKKAGVILLESANGESVGMANIYAYLDDIGINYNTNVRRSEGQCDEWPNVFF